MHPQDMFVSSLMRFCYAVMKVIRARKAVISNASTWDTVPMIPPRDLPMELRTRAESTPQCDSFMHLHLGIDAKVINLNSKETISSQFCCH